KTSEELLLQPFADESFLKLTVFNDINVLFGAKGTGKSCILDAVAKHYAESGLNATVYEHASDRLDEIFDIKGNDLQINLDTYAINYCSDEIELIRGAEEAGVTSLARYVAYFASKSTNRSAKRILLKDIDPEEEGTAKRAFLSNSEAVAKTQTYLAFLETSDPARQALGEDAFARLLE